MPGRKPKAGLHGVVTSTRPAASTAGASAGSGAPGAPGDHDARGPCEEIAFEALG